MGWNRRTLVRSVAIGVLGAGGCLDGTGNTDRADGTQVPGSRTANATTAASAGGTTGVGTEVTTGTRTETERPTRTADATSTESDGRTTSGTGTETTAEPTCESGLQRLQIDFPENFELAYREGFGFELTADPGNVSVGDELAFELQNTTDEPQTTGPKTKYAIERRVEDGWRHVLSVPTGYTSPTDRVTHQPGEGFSWRFPVSQQGFSVDPYTVCAPLESGEYHFTYWGFPDAMRGLTIGFDIE